MTNEFIIPDEFYMDSSNNLHFINKGNANKIIKNSNLKLIILDAQVWSGVFNCGLIYDEKEEPIRINFPIYKTLEIIKSSKMIDGKVIDDSFSLELDLNRSIVNKHYDLYSETKQKDHIKERKILSKKIIDKSIKNTSKLEVGQLYRSDSSNYFIVLAKDQTIPQLDFGWRGTFDQMNHSKFDIEGDYVAPRVDENKTTKCKYITLELGNIDNVIEVLKNNSPINSLSSIKNYYSISFYNDKKKLTGRNLKKVFDTSYDFISDGKNYMKSLSNCGYVMRDSKIEVLAYSLYLLDKKNSSGIPEFLENNKDLAKNLSKYLDRKMNETYCLPYVSKLKGLLEKC